MTLTEQAQALLEALREEAHVTGDLDVLHALTHAAKVVEYLEEVPA